MNSVKDKLIFRDWISGKKDIAGEWKAEDTLNTLTSYYNLGSKEQLIEKKSCRDIGIYLMKEPSISLTQVGALGYDPAHVRLPSDSVGVLASFS